MNIINDAVNAINDMRFPITYRLSIFVRNCSFKNERLRLDLIKQQIELF